MLLIGIVCLGLAAPTAFSGPTQFIGKQPAGTLDYKIVLSGEFDGGSTAGTPKEKQWHDVIHIHRVIEVTTAMYRVPAASDPNCGKACGEDWSGNALESLQQRVRKRCKRDYACGAKMMVADTNAITVLENLQSWAAKGPTWAMMTPCIATTTIADTETLTRYVYAGETANPTGKVPGLATRKGRVSGQLRNVACARLLDSSYVVYLTAPRDEKGYIVQFPPFVVPVKIVRGGGSDSENDHVAGFVLRGNALRIGDDPGKSPLALPALGQPFHGKRSIKILFQLDSSPVFHRNLRVPVRAEVVWHFSPAPANPAVSKRQVLIRLRPQQYSGRGFYRMRAAATRRSSDKRMFQVRQAAPVSMISTPM